MKLVQGGADALIGMIGLGVAPAGTTGPDHRFLSPAVRVVSETPLNARGIWGSYLDCVYPKRYIVEGGQTSTGSIIACSVADERHDGSGCAEPEGRSLGA